MKNKSVFFLVLFLPIYSFWQSALFKGDNGLLPGNLVIDYQVNIQDLQNDDPVDSCNFFSYESIIHDLGGIIVENVKTGKTPVYAIDNQNFNFPYNIFDNPIKLDLSEVAALLGEKIVKVLTPEGEVAVKKVIDPKEIKGFEFIEEWEWNNQNFNFSKKVIAYNPIRIRDDYVRRNIKSGSFYVIDTCIINRDTSIKNNMKLAAKIRYEFYLDKQYCEERNLINANVSTPFLYSTSIWNRTTQNAFVHLLCNSVIDGKKEAYNYTTNRKLTIGQAKEALGIRIDTVNVLNLVDGGEEKALVQKDFDPERIKSVIFIEDWYMDEATLLIKKNVIGIAPVFYEDVYDSDIPKIRKTVPFVVYLNVPKNL